MIFVLDINIIFYEIIQYLLKKEYNNIVIFFLQKYYMSFPNIHEIFVTKLLCFHMNFTTVS